MKDIITKTLRVQSPLSSIDDFGDYVVMIDKKLRAYFLGNKGQKSSAQNLECYVDERYHAATTLCNKTNKLCYAKPETTELAILALRENVFNFDGIISHHEKEVESCEVSNDGKFLATGGCDGKAFIYDFNNLSVIKTFKRKPDYIHKLLFSADSRFFALSAFDMSVKIFDLKKYETIFQVKLPAILEDFKFIQNNLFIAMRNGQCGIIQDKTLDIFKESLGFWITTVEITKDKNFAIMCGKSDRLVVLNLKTKAVVLKAPLTRNSGVSLIKFIGNMLYISYSDGVVETVDFYKYFRDGSMAIAAKDYASACRYVKENPFLVLKEGFLDAINDGWFALQDRLFSLLLAGKLSEALNIAEPFFIDEAKKTEFSFMAAKMPEIAKFTDAVDANDIKKAYMLAEKFTYLKKIFHYEKLEAKWKKDFNNAKKVLEANPKLNKQKTLEMLAEYQVVDSKKAMILNLVNQIAKFTEAETYIKNKDFKAYFSMCLSFPFLENTELYAKALSFGDSMLLKAVSLEREKDYDAALIMLDIAINFPHLKKTANDLVNNIKSKQAFLKALKDGYINNAFALVNSTIEHMSEFVQLTKSHEKLFEEAAIVANSGEEVMLNRLLAPVEQISYWSARVNTLKRICYIEILKSNFASYDYPTRKEKVRFCISMYGEDPELEKLCKTYNMFDFYDDLTK